jgi:hypothetical protein
MTKHLSTSSMVSSASGKKCKKPCQSSSSSSSCCTEQCIDCCSSQYQRLSSFRAFVVNQQLNNPSGGATAFPYQNGWMEKINSNTTTVSTSGAVFNRCGVLVPAPDAVSPPTGSGTSLNAGSAYYQNNLTGCTLPPFAPTSLNTGNTEVAEAAYYFVNEFAYGPYEPGCHNDQVWGWYVNISTGELQLFTQTDGVPTTSTRLCLSSQDVLSSTEKRQLKVLNKLYKLTKSAVKEINGIPSQEGNIVEVCDCKGQRWLLYINTAQAQNGSPLSSCNYQFSIVATKLC